MPCSAPTGVGEAAFAADAHASASTLSAVVTKPYRVRVTNSLLAKKRGAEAPLVKSIVEAINI
jgi:hypothetical protein